MLQRLQDFWRDETGQDLIEYTLLIAFLAIATAASVASGRSSVHSVWTAANSTINQAATLAGS